MNGPPWGKMRSLRWWVLLMAGSFALWMLLMAMGVENDWAYLGVGGTWGLFWGLFGDA